MFLLVANSTIDIDLLYQQIGSTIQDLRQAKNPKLTQADLANLLGVTRTSITNIEQGKQRITLHLLYTLCERLSVQISDVIPAIENVVIQSTNPALRAANNAPDMPPKTAALIESLENEKK